MSRTIAIPGGSGFLGTALGRALVARGDRVVVLTRGRAGVRDGIEHAHWDATTPGEWARHLDGADVVVHMTGKRVDCRPTRRNIAELVSSRVDPVRLVGRVMADLDSPPPVWVQAATLAVYGDTGDEVITEATPVSGVGRPQMVQVAMAWERAVAEATADVLRTVLCRIAVGIGGDDDPATARLATLVRLGAGGAVAGGQQWMSWIALDDLVRALVLAIDEPDLHGTVHLVSPNPVRNAELMATLRELMGRRVGLPATAWMTRIGAPLLGSDPALALTGRRAHPARLIDAGFEFATPDLRDALRIALAAT